MGLVKCWVVVELEPGLVENVSDTADTIILLLKRPQTQKKSARIYLNHYLKSLEQTFLQVYTDAESGKIFC